MDSLHDSYLGRLAAPISSRSPVKYSHSHLKVYPCSVVLRSGQEVGTGTTGVIFERGWRRAWVEVPFEHLITTHLTEEKNEERGVIYYRYAESSRPWPFNKVAPMPYNMRPQKLHGRPPLDAYYESPFLHPLFKYMHAYFPLDEVRVKFENPEHSAKVIDKFRGILAGWDEWR